MEQRPNVTDVATLRGESAGNVPAQVREPVIGAEQVQELTRVLEKYKAGKKQTEQRVVASENWWKLRNTVEEQKETAVGLDGGFTSRSGWLHNVIVSKHADVMEAYPEPNVLPREESDQPEAKVLSAILPCILEKNSFEATYSDAMWQKLKTGTGVYKVYWDSSKLHSLGDIGIECVSLLNVYWEPGVKDIQRSRYFFHTELFDKDVLEGMYPDKLKDKLKGKSFMSTKFLYDDHVDTENKVTVIEVYYHKTVGGKQILHYCKYVGDVVLFATENEVQPILDANGAVIRPPMAQTGLYDHGKYPYVFDALYPIEGSPCGYGFVDICRNPQTEIDLLKTSFVRNAVVGATPRFLSRSEGAVNEAEFLDLSKPIVHVNGNVSEEYLRQIDFRTLDGTYLSMMDRSVQELRETSGNTEASTGNAPSAVTSASGIAALQEASGKGSKDSTRTSYRAFGLIVDFCIELIRQFYDMPRKFRILGERGAEEFIRYSNQGLKPQHQGFDFGRDMGYRLPVFDIKVSAQKKNVYTKVSQNELALQFFQMGFFNPQMTDQALMCLSLMDFDGKDTVIHRVAQNGTMQQKLLQYMKLALSLAAEAAPDMVPGLSQDIMQTVGGEAAALAQAAPVPESDPIKGIQKKEHAFVERARANSNEASQPEGGKVIGEGDKR